MTLPKESTMIENAALAAWLEYTGYHDRFRPDYDDGGDWEEQRQCAVTQWYEWPNSCTHVGAEGFRNCVRAVLTALRDPTPEMIAAGMKCADISLSAEFTAMIDEVLSPAALTEGEGHD